MKILLWLTLGLFIPGMVAMAQGQGKQKEKPAKVKTEQSAKANPANQGGVENKSQADANQHGQRMKAINQDYKEQKKAIRNDPALTKAQQKEKLNLLREKHNESIQAENTRDKAEKADTKAKKAEQKAKARNAAEVEKANKGKGKGKD